jgi:hypothetical protein
MAKGGSRKGSRGVNSKQTKPTLPWRPFREWPPGPFVESVLQHLKDTAQPETMPSLFRNQISKNEEFRIIRKDITLDGTKRPEGDNAPCPMCTPNKFLTCSLVYLPNIQACAVIGHCCADKQNAADAERDYKRRTTERHEEDYLLGCLPLVEARMTILTSLKPAAAEALRLYRRFRKDLPQVQALLRHTKHQYRGNLILSEIIRGGEDDEKENDYFGPAGFRGRGTTDIETREHNYGLMSGTLAVIQDYNPVKELEWLTRQLASVHALPTEDAALEFICAIDDRQRHAGVVIMEGVDEGIIKFTNRVREFLQFITRENAQVLNAFGTSDHNSVYFTAEYETLHKRPSLRIKQGSKTCKLEVGPQFSALEFTWPTPPKPI